LYHPQAITGGDFLPDTVSFTDACNGVKRRGYEKSNAISTFQIWRQQFHEIAHEKKSHRLFYHERCYFSSGKAIKPLIN